MNTDKQELRDGVKSHLEQYQLNGEQLQALMNLQTDATGSLPATEAIAKGVITPNKGRIRDYLSLASAAVFLLAIIVSWQTNVFVSPSSDIPLAIAKEVAKNHIKLKPLEVRSNNLSVIRDYFTELDFSPVQSRWYQGRATNLLGARYCSIAGVSAAQIRYQGDNAELQTLYQVGYNPDIYGDIPDIDNAEKPLIITIKGIRTEIWLEQGLLMATAESQP